VSGDGDFVSVGGDPNARGYDFTMGGVTVGVDYRLTKNLAIGLVGGYAHTWTDLVRNGRVDVNSGKTGLFATWWDQGLYVNGFVGGGFNSYNTSRGALQGFASSNSRAKWRNPFRLVTDDGQKGYKKRDFDTGADGIKPTFVSDGRRKMLYKYVNGNVRADG